MTIEEIRKGAPPEATHYQKQKDSWRYMIIKNNKIHKVWCYGDWVIINIPCGLIHRIMFRIKPL